jgi:hypothetical protein
MSDDNRAIRDTLFGDMPLSEWASASRGHGDGSPWKWFSAAQRYIESGELRQAVDALQAVVQAPGLESRQYLQAWHALRQLDVFPADDTARVVHGVVVEVGLEAGLDLVAGYADYSARYFNFSGAGIVWELRDETIDRFIEDLLRAGEPVVEATGPWEGDRPPAPGTGMLRLNVLTPGGLYFGQGAHDILAADPLGGPVVYAALRLMEGLIGRVESQST